MIRKIMSVIACLAALAAGCSDGTSSPAGGLMVVMDIGPTISGSKLDHLSVAVSSLDGKTIYRDAGYAIDQPDATMALKFPATLFIASNGLPTASVAIDLGLWDTQGPIDVRKYSVTGIPTNRVAELKVIFDKDRCPPEGLVPLLPGCTSTLVGTDLPTLGGDAGPAPFSVVDAGQAESSAGDASVDARVDAPVVDADAGSGDAAPLDSSDEGVPDASSAPASPCDPACVEGQTHCVDTTCKSVPPSCLGGGPGAGFNCGGPSGTDDCCGNLRVPLTPEGTFFRDYDRGNGGHNDSSHPATVSQFRLDVYEVTVGRFRKFVDASVGGDAAAPWFPQSGSGKHVHLNGGMGLIDVLEAGTVFESGWDPSWNTNLPTTKADWDTALQQGPPGCYQSYPFYTWTTTAGANEDLPLTCVTWYAAYAFCVWDGGFLPSRTEWDYAAAGGSEQRVYPWADYPITPDYAVYNCYYGAGTPFGNNCVGVGNMAPVGSLPKGRGLWGQLDLAGNVLEWNLDYGGAYPVVQGPDGGTLPCQDCASTTTGSQRYLSGGGFDSASSQLESAYALVSRPQGLHGDVGLRCARTP